ncbi:MAG: hypothetical protein ACI9SJ_000104 [Flavobacteriaceae bacterium]|jgi:hypothetical protein|uniref:DUF7033 domain-containing protein n=1 Tax=Candidatus Marifrigoribacter sp. Uisw_064 TaxID=3230970 RepID=UPI003AE27D90
MLLIYTQKITPRFTYVFKHICTRILGIEIKFTNAIETFIAEEGPKLSYGKQPLGNELFLQSHIILSHQGIESVELTVKNWEETKCFFQVSDKSALPFDIFSASFYLLSRYEEYLPHVKDEQGRFPASESLAFKEDFLQYPVIDIWAYKFKEVLSESFPALVFLKKTMEIHNLIEASNPYAFKEKGLLKSIIGYTKDSLKFRISKNFRRTKVLLGIKEDPFNTFEWVVSLIKNSSTKLTVFFLMGNDLNYYEGINTQKKKYRMLIKFLSDYKNIGLIFSSISLLNINAIKKEKEQLESIINSELTNSVNKGYYVNLPDFYRNLIEVEVERDFTMVYEEYIGFRASTCTPFLFYDLDYEIKTPLVIHPIALTTSSFKNKKSEDIKDLILEVKDSVSQVNGTFSIFFTNLDFIDIKKNKVWRFLFSEKLQDYV